MAMPAAVPVEEGGRKRLRPQADIRHPMLTGVGLIKGPHAILNDGKKLLLQGAGNVRKRRLKMVPRAGIEPARLASRDFKSRMSTYFIIGAGSPGRL
jgi:hypothetical protein